MEVTPVARWVDNFQYFWPSERLAMRIIIRVVTDSRMKEETDVV